MSFRKLKIQITLAGDKVFFTNVEQRCKTKMVAIGGYFKIDSYLSPNGPIKPSSGLIDLEVQGFVYKSKGVFKMEGYGFPFDMEVEQ